MILNFTEPGVYPQSQKILALGEDVTITGVPGVVLDFSSLPAGGIPCVRVGGTVDWAGTFILDDLAPGATEIILEGNHPFEVGDWAMLSSRVHTIANPGDGPWWFAAGCYQGELAKVLGASQLGITVTPLRRGGSMAWLKAHRVQVPHVVIHDVTLLGGEGSWVLDVTDCTAEVYNVKAIGGTERCIEFTRVVDSNSIRNVTTARSFSEAALASHGTCYGICFASCQNVQAAHLFAMDGKHAIAFGGDQICEDVWVFDSVAIGRETGPDIMAVQYHAGCAGCRLIGCHVFGGIGGSNASNTVEDCFNYSRSTFPLYWSAQSSGDVLTVKNSTFVTDNPLAYCWVGPAFVGPKIKKVDLTGLVTVGGLFGLNVNATAPWVVKSFSVGGSFALTQNYGFQLQGPLPGTIHLDNVSAPGGRHIAITSQP